MRKILVLFILTIIFESVYSQQLEIGPTIGYGFVNIVDSKSDNERAVIGNALWSLNYGLNAIYYFKNPNEKTTGRVGFLYRSNQRGSISELNNNNKFKFNSNAFAVFGGIGGNIGNGFIFYLDAGFGYNSLDNSSFYQGNLNQNEAFEALDSTIEIKSSEVTFIYSIGMEKAISKNHFKIFLELNGDAAISKLNKNKGAYRTQSLGFGTGFRYIFDLRRNNS